MSDPGSAQAKVRRAVLSVAGAARGAYVERRQPTRAWLDERAFRVGARLRDGHRARASAWTALRERIEREGVALRDASDERLAGTIDELRTGLRRGDGAYAAGLGTPALARAFALGREVAERSLGLRPYDVQLRAAWVLLQGMVAEMATGEGKTLAAAPAVITMGLAGAPTHVITVNDYLARRDAEGMSPLYARFGLSVGVIQEGMSASERREQYARDVTYCTNKELAFDYLKDRITLGRGDGRARLAVERVAAPASRRHQLILRGLWFGIVDEADSVLVDEARTPLIISGSGGDGGTREIYATALQLARELARDEHFRLELRSRRIELTDAGRARLRERGAEVGGLFSGERRRSDLVHQALVALHALERDRDYLVRDARVQIIDEFTGRVMADRAWEQGLHQLVEVKEEVELTARRDPLARISYQRFFTRYLRLAGMTGTAQEVSGELREVYGLHVVRIPTHRPVARRDLGERVFATAEEKWRAVVARIAELHRSGRPVLVGTRSVAASESLAARLDAVGIPHRVLNARQDEAEAEIVAEAGQRGRVTVATNMAGRGTDIGLGEGVAELGGLAVLGTERHEARRIDRQLFGRSGRQGDPGSCEMFVSFEDEIIAANTPAAGLARRGLAGAGRSLGSAAVRAAQLRAERSNARTRRQLLRYDAELGNALAFSGRGE